MENSLNPFLNNAPENNNQPSPEKNSENQQEKIQKLKEFLIDAEAPALETEEMEALRNNPLVWEEKANEVIEQKAKGDAIYGTELQLVCAVEVAILYKEQGNDEMYIESMKSAIEFAQQIRYHEVRDRLEELL